MPNINTSQRTSVGFKTTDNTASTAAAFDTSNSANAAFTVLAKITARETADSDEVNGYILAATFKRDGGTLTQVSTTTVVHSAEGTGAWTADLDASGDDIRVRVTGANSTVIKWLVDLDVQVNDESPFSVS